MTHRDNILQSLIQHCKESEIIPSDAVIDANDDLFEYGLIDSMGLTLLSCVIEEHFELQIMPELLVAELRSPKAISTYIAENIQ